jgi:hypothetical protein
MRDQLACLIEKMNQQQHRIQNLEVYSSQKSSRFPQRKPQEGSKRPGAIATYPKDQ